MISIIAAQKTQFFAVEEVMEKYPDV